MASLTTEDSTKPSLVTHNEPRGPQTATGPGSVGQVAVMDAVLIIGIAWILLALLWFSLRRYTV